MAINLSAQDMDGPNLVSELITLLVPHAVNPRLIELEFTESALIHSPEQLRAKLEAIRLLGLNNLAHKLRLRVVAEGIETYQAFATLAAWGCDEGQWYWIARPMPAEQVEAWLIERAGRGGALLKSAWPVR